MSSKEQDITESDLLAYVDGEVHGVHRDRIEQYLASNAAAATLVEEWRQQNRRLGALYGPVAAEAVPDRLRVREWQRPRPAMRATTWARAAAAAALVAFGMSAGWFGHAIVTGRHGAAEPLVAQAVEAHDLFSSEVMHPVEVRAEDSAHLKGWLSKRLDRNLSIPDLSPFGLTLVGGRLLPAADGTPAAQIMYEDAGGERLTLYVAPVASSRETAFHYASIKGLETVTWTDENVNCAVVGGLPRDRLQAIAKAAYAQLI